MAIHFYWRNEDKGFCSERRCGGALIATSMRGERKRIEYPSMRAMDWQATPSMHTPAPNCYTLEADERNWHAEGKHFSLYLNNRTFYAGPGSASATDFYNTDQGSKVSLYHRSSRSPYRYASMRSSSAGRTGKGLGIDLLIATDEKVGPGSYDVDVRKQPPALPRHPVGTSAFASTSPRIGKGGGTPYRTAEPGFATVREDHKHWGLSENRQMKGKSFGCAQRWQRLPGPGTNLPAQKIPPGPGSYGELHSWPDKGFRGTAKGFSRSHDSNPRHPACANPRITYWRPTVRQITSRCRTSSATARCEAVPAPSSSEALSLCGLAIRIDLVYVWRAAAAAARACSRALLSVSVLDCDISPVSLLGLGVKRGGFLELWSRDALLKKKNTVQTRRLERF